MRAIARDLGRLLGCYGYVSALRRTRVGPFTEADSVTMITLDEDPNAVFQALRSVDTGLLELPCIRVTSDGALRLHRGQSVIVRGADAPEEGEVAYATLNGVVVAIGTIEHGSLVPNRVFNL